MKWTLELRNLKDLKHHAKNARRLSKHDAEHLEKSLEKFGVIDKPIVTKDGLIIGGHQRVQVLKKMGHNQVECYVAQDKLTEKEIDELNIRLNKAVGDWDTDILANQWELDDLLDWGFKPEELHLESVPENNDKPKIYQLTAKFENEDDLRQAETHIAAIIDLYASASYKVKVK